MPDLCKKLGILPGKTVCLIGAPPDTAQAIQALCSKMVTYLDSLSTQKVDILFFWPKDLSGLAERLADLQDQIDPDGAIWVVMPKKKYAGARGIDFTWEEMQAAGLSTDLVDNKVASINDVEYGTRFVIRKERREKYRLA